MRVASQPVQHVAPFEMSWTRPNLARFSPEHAPPAPVSTTSLNIPDVRGFLAAAPRCALARNRIITGGYQQLGALVQDIVDPNFRRERVSRVAPNWFAMGAYVSNMGGKNMVALARARTLVASGRDGDAVLPGDVTEKAIEAFRPVLARYGVTSALGAILLFLYCQGAGVQNWTARALPTLARRSLELLNSSARRGLGSKVDEIMHTAYNALSDGNLAIYSDIGTAAQDFFELRRACGPFDEDEPLLHALAARWAPGSARTLIRDAREIATHCRDHLGCFDALCRLSDRFSHLGPKRGLALLGAGFTLYEQARRATTVDEKNRVVAAANALLALREQRDIVQRAFEGRSANEIDRADVFRLVTPFITIVVGPECWRFNSWAYTVSAREVRAGHTRSRFDSPASQFNWAIFDQRWIPILDFFERMYAMPDLVWVHRCNPDPWVETCRSEVEARSIDVGWLG